ncbi:Transmembrane exosortase (Exosortase_EpsH) [Candidatus Methanoperedenaceae archaeon GB50]|nr:Transmembrane exosortase (Exosortase_EpsH) [Candidatus Methanoperedenaceae archaeon GB50]CAD7781458.1 MAG: Transmembrane exosortase (Exosortase_EpsH) [Candidatus Methanoperedenaceae archaeon GB50]
MTRGDRYGDLLNSEAFKLLSLFFILVLIFSVVYILFRGSIAFLNDLTAIVLGFILSIFGLDAAASGSAVRVNGFGMEIVDECTGIFEMLVYAAAVLAFPTSRNKKAIGLAFGIPLLGLLNMVRLICLAFVGMYYPESFEFVHLYLWQVTLILLIVIVLSIWILRVVKVEG